MSTDTTSIVSWLSRTVTDLTDKYTCLESPEYSPGTERVLSEYSDYRTVNSFGVSFFLFLLSNTYVLTGCIVPSFIIRVIVSCTSF